jgi:subtilase family serine protease
MSRTRRGLLRSVVALAAFVAPAAVGVSTAPAATSRASVGSAVRLPASSLVLGSLSSATALHVTVALEPRNAGQLSSMATAVSTPGSPLFRHYLSVSQFAQRFGATDAQIAAVKSALTAAGLHVGNAEANHLTLSVSGTTAEVEKAFSVSLVQVRLASNRVAYANTTAPTLPSSVASAVRGVVGLNNLVRLQPAGPMAAETRHGFSRQVNHPNIVTGGPQPCTAASNAGVSRNSYTADFLASMYGFSSLYGAGDLGAGQTVAIFELEGNINSDITAFKTCYGTSTSVTYTPVDGGPDPLTGNDGLETELDIETVAELAPAASIIVYQAPNHTLANGFDEYSAIVSQDLAKVVSTSWGLCEPDNDPSSAAAEATVFQEAAMQGQSILGASGDAGSAACSQNDGSPSSSDDMLAVQDPTSQPFVTGVGGTTLWNGTTSGGIPVLWSPGHTLDQAVWNDGLNGNGPSASTGGISIFQKMPAYQSGAAAGLGVGTGGSGMPCAATSGLCREVPDVSALADPDTGYVINYNGSWTAVGGTSGAAPLWAGFIADTNASAGCGGLPVGFLNPALYAIASSSAYSNNFSDITMANPSTGFAHNDALFGHAGIDPAAGLYPVKPGYSMASGLGSPIVPALGASLCGVRTEVVSVTNPGNQLTLVGTPVSVQVHGTGVGTTFGAAGLPAGVSINPTTGLISGTVTTAQNTTVTVTGTDADGHAGTSQFTWTVVKPTVTITNPGNQSSTVRHAVSVTVKGTDSGGQPLTFSATGLPAGLRISSAGVISGTPTTAQTTSVTVTARDSAGGAGSTHFSWKVSRAAAVTKPSTKSVAFAGLAKGKPKLAFTVNAGTNAPALKSVSVTLPKGLGFDNAKKTLSKGLGVRSSRKKVKFAVNLKHGVLTITFNATLRSVSIALARPTISISRSEATKIKTHKVKQLIVHFTTTDASHKSVRFSITLKKLS